MANGAKNPLRMQVRKDGIRQKSYHSKCRNPFPVCYPPSMEMELLIGAVLLLASIVFSKASSRFGIPSLIVFLLVGIAAGPEGFGHISFDQPDATTLIGTVALN